MSYHLPASDPPIRYHRMEGFVKPTQNQGRRVDRWNSVLVPERVALRALERVEKQPDGCWISLYSVASHGYSQIGWQDGTARHVVLGHRAAWVAVHGQVPLGMTIDHVCKVRRCVNPAHLRLLPNFENARRINGKDWPIGTCRRGHTADQLVPITRRTKSGAKRTGVTCGECMRISRQKYIEKMKGMAA